MTPTTIPITVTPEAAARIAELGMQAEFEQMLEHTLQTVPGLQSLEVQVSHPYDLGDDVSLSLMAAREDPELEYDPADRDWGDWKIRHFSPDVCRYFHLLSYYETNHGR